MKRLMIVVLVVVLTSAMVAAGCAGTPVAAPNPTAAPATPASKTIDIGIATPLTGSSAYIGNMMQNGILLAIEDQNNQGGVTIAGQKYMLNPIVRDDKADLIVAKSVAEELVFDKGVKVIGGAFIADAVGIQMVTEPNKVIMFGMVAFMPSMTGPNKPYSFYCAWPIEQMFSGTFAYLQKFYPNAKKIASMSPDNFDVPVFMGAATTMAPVYGLDWLGYEKFPLDTKDFMPVISRVLAKNPDVVDTGSTGGMTGVCGTLIKQLREAGFEGPITIAVNTDIPTVEQVVPAKELNRVILNSIDPKAPVASEAFREFYGRWEKRFGSDFNSIAALDYNPMKAFFEFLNTQNSMDSTAWMEGFAKYHWQGLFGFENYWVGKPLKGIDRFVFGPSWLGEWTGGKLSLDWSAPLPYDMFVEK